jgi:hypothetical protein
MQNDKSYILGVAGLIGLVAVIIGWRLHHKSSRRAAKSGANSEQSSNTAQQTARTTVGRRSPFDNARQFEEAVADVPDSMANSLPSIFRDWQKRQERAPVIRYHLADQRVWARGSFAPEPGAIKTD